MTLPCGSFCTVTLPSPALARSSPSCACVRRARSTAVTPRKGARKTVTVRLNTTTAASGPSRCAALDAALPSAAASACGSAAYSGSTQASSTSASRKRSSSDRAPIHGASGGIESFFMGGTIEVVDVVRGRLVAPRSIFAVRTCVRQRALASIARVRTLGAARAIGAPHHHACAAIGRAMSDDASHRRRSRRVASHPPMSISAEPVACSAARWRRVGRRIRGHGIHRHRAARCHAARRRVVHRRIRRRVAALPALVSELCGHAMASCVHALQVDGVVLPLQVVATNIRRSCCPPRCRTAAPCLHRSPRPVRPGPTPSR